MERVYSDEPAQSFGVNVANLSSIFPNLANFPRRILSLG